MKKTEEEISKIIIESVEEAKACFDTEQEFISWLDNPVENKFAVLKNKEWEEIIITVINNSTWGSHRTGGPVWVMDFSYENVKSLLPDNPWVPYFSKDKCNESIKILVDYVEKFIRSTCINNVLVIYPNEDIHYKGRLKMKFFTDWRILKHIDTEVFPLYKTEVQGRWGYKQYSIEETECLDLLLGAEIKRLSKGEYIVCVNNLPKEPIADLAYLEQYWDYALYHIDKGNRVMSPVKVKKSGQVKDYLPMYIADVMEDMRLAGLDTDMRHEFWYNNLANKSERIALLKEFGSECASGIVPVNRVDKIKMVYQTLELKMTEITEEHWFKQLHKKIKWEEL